MVFPSGSVGDGSGWLVELAHAGCFLAVVGDGMIASDGNKGLGMAGDVVVGDGV